MTAGRNLPRPTAEALHAYRDLAGDLSQWAPTVHRLVRERIAALMEANGRWEHPTETAEEYAQRVLAHGQFPFPQGVCLYDDDNHNSNISYEHIDVGYGVTGDEVTRITYTGWYPHWKCDGQSYERRTATIHCPGWLVTDLDGVDRFRRQTADMCEAVRRERADEDARISALIDSLADG
ncbi:hypothetical protein ABZ671_01580 [Micromonospora sp. NPDC006766]|uniref:hypothetical protein n=1 Tax=Micromonospora sp. NPDC006766 TaxID=3154778 RepID=UPI0033DD3F3B